MSKAPQPAHSSSGTSSTVLQNRPQTQHCNGQHQANHSRHAVQQQQRNGCWKTGSLWPLPASDDQHCVPERWQPSSSWWWRILARIHFGTCAPASPFCTVCAAGLAASGPSIVEWYDRSVMYQSPDWQWHSVPTVIASVVGRQCQTTVSYSSQDGYWWTHESAFWWRLVSVTVLYHIAVDNSPIGRGWWMVILLDIFLTYFMHCVHLIQKYVEIVVIYWTCNKFLMKAVRNNTA